MTLLKFDPPKELAHLRVKIARDVQKRVERYREFCGALELADLVERGLLLENVKMAMEKPIPPAYWGLSEAVLGTRKILRSLAAAREHSTIPKAQVQAKDELERMKNNGAE